MSTAARPKPATLEDFLAIPAEERFHELLGGEIVRKAVMRWAEPGYVTVLAAQRGEVVRAEPFDAIELDVGTLFGDDPRL